MKSPLSLTLFFTFLFTTAFSQEQAYKFKQDIPYYDKATYESDPYIRERGVLDIYYPSDKKDFATVVLFHGGSLKRGNKKIPEALKEQGICVIAANYRFHPKVKAPSYIEDAAAAVAWTIKNIENYGGDSSLVFVSGYSAGGYLTSMVGLDKRFLEAHHIDANHIAGLIPFSGHTITHFTVRSEMGIDKLQPTVDEYAPLYYVRADAPPLLLITGDRELELLGRYEENAYMMRMMKGAGHPDTRLYELQGYGHSMKEPAYPLLLKEIARIVEAKTEASAK
ncbi:alpha/beta hydrolase [Puniceicoccaceae bacterium K14]|nr:alpha/beta hydrolase [Puniceicoccaceae bacterium K14]